MEHVASSRPPSNPLAITVADRARDGRTAVVAVDGELDLATAPDLKRTLCELLSNGRSRLVLDLSQASFVDSTGLSVLVGVHRRLAPDERLAIAGAHERVLDVLERSGLAATLRVFPTIDAALAYAKTGASGTDSATATPLTIDAALMLGIASTAMPFAQSPEDEAERWLRVLRGHGESAVVLASLGVSEAPIRELGRHGHSDQITRHDPDVIATVTEHASRLAAQRKAAKVATTDMLLAVMRVYGETFDRVLGAHGADVEELAGRLAVARPPSADR
jgi:anti-sigma B factor antagonist